MHSETHVAEQFNKAQVRGRMVAIAAAMVAVALLLAWNAETTRSIVSIWYRSETYAHGFVIVPIVVWLIWRDRARLATVPIQPTLWPLVGLVIVGFGWLVAELASVVGGSQFMLVAMIPLAIWAILGTAVVRALAFPLGFLFFAVPFGDFVVPILMDWTADFTVMALRATGVPVLREGRNFAIPSGNWSVVEACSGVRYLIASLVVGTLYAYLTYRTISRRLAFVGLALLVPLIANWLRAYMIVMIGHLSENRLAVGVDHLIYGWVFFGVVMGLLFWIAPVWLPEKARQPEAVRSQINPVQGPDKAARNHGDYCGPGGRPSLEACLGVSRIAYFELHRSCRLLHLPPAGIPSPVSRSVFGRTSQIPYPKRPRCSPETAPWWAFLSLTTEIKRRPANW